MTLKLNKIVILLCITFCVGSCDRFTSVEFYGTNNTDKIILFKVFSSDKADSTIFELNPNDVEKQIRIDPATTRGTKKFNCCPCFYNFLKVEVKDSGKKVIKNPSSSDNWTHKVVKGKFTKTADKIQCFFIINQSDLQ